MMEILVSMGSRKFHDVNSLYMEYECQMLQSIFFVGGLIKCNGECRLNFNQCEGIIFLKLSK